MSDLLDASAAFARPGMDSRQWISLGLVDAETPSARSVSFDAAVGPIVNVTLQPSGIPVPCRVGAMVAGGDEGEWYPFLPGDEVVVAVPEGDERAGCVILCRLYNAIDAWPKTVAGQDATKNVFGFRRMRTPYVIETASSFSFRSALTGANLTIDQAGNLFLVSGDGQRLTFSADGIQIGNSDASSFFQIDTDTGDAVAQAGQAQLIVSETASTFMTPGTLGIVTGGAGSPQHAVSLEQVVNLFLNFLYLLHTAGDISMWSGPGKILDSTGGFPAALQTALVTWLSAAASPIPPTPAAGGGLLALFFPLVYGPVGVISSSLQSQLANFDITGLVPGIGRPSLTI
jgi:hypothetical protein